MSRGDFGDCKVWDDNQRPGGKEQEERGGGPKPNIGTWFERSFGTAEDTCYVFYEVEFRAYPRFDSANGGVNATFVLEVSGGGVVRHRHETTVYFGGPNQRSTINLNSNWREDWRPEWGRPHLRLRYTNSDRGDVGFATERERTLLEFGRGAYQNEVRP